MRDADFCRLEERVRTLEKRLDALEPGNPKPTHEIMVTPTPEKCGREWLGGPGSDVCSLPKGHVGAHRDGGHVWKGGTAPKPTPEPSPEPEPTDE